jgi:two-component system chemotaxis response regulator CheY
MPHPRVLSVGQCSYDHAMIARTLEAAFQARTSGAATAAEALEALRSGTFDLVLVNRIGNRDGAPGVDLIRELQDDPSLAPVPVMLVSNDAKAQAQAVALGARPGFGKAELHSPTTRALLANVLPAGE